MVDKCIDIIFYNTVSIIIGELGKEKKYIEAYKKYLKEHYEEVLHDLIEQLGEEIIKDAVEIYIDSEKRFWSAFNAEGMLSILEEDLAYEQVRLLSELAFSQAIECNETNTFLDDEKEYERQIEEINKWIKDVKYFNENRASTLLSEAILDIEYAFNKTKYMSLRLGRYV